MIEIIIGVGVFGGGIWLIIRHIKKLNIRVLDERGYERNGYDQLIHRRVAFKKVYNPRIHCGRFREFIVHHKDKNKRNNSPENLQIMSSDEHNRLHGY